VDRQLEEALTRGPDPLHLASVFGLDEKTAIRYANAARQLLESSAESKAGVGDANGHVEATLTAAASGHLSLLAATRKSRTRP
jgi:hypothetical protein